MSAIINQAYRNIIQEYDLKIVDFDEFLYENKQPPVVGYDHNNNIQWNIQLEHDTFYILKDTPRSKRIDGTDGHPVGLRFHSLNLEKPNFYHENYVDGWWLHNLLTDNKALIFTSMDTYHKTLINMPLGFMDQHCISQSSDYYKTTIHDQCYYRRIFWRGNATHVTRTNFVNFARTHSSGLFDVDFVKNFNPYGEKKPHSGHYRDYCKHLLFSDICLGIRGDLPWLYSFFDMLRLGTVPCLIDCYFYSDLGWENIGINPNDIFLSFKSSETPFEEICNTIVELLNNKEKILYMKNCIYKFMKNYIYNDTLLHLHNGHPKYSGWADFIIAKCIELKQNNFVIDNHQFFSSKIHEVKYILNH